MDITLDHLAALALGRLSPDVAATVRRALATSSELEAAYERLLSVAQTLKADQADPVPAPAIAAAKNLGRRLESLKAPSVRERIEGALRSVVARLVFDSRLDGPIVGLRGGSGFVVSYEVEGDHGPTDIELECVPVDHDASGDAFELVGMATGPNASLAGCTLSVRPDDPQATERWTTTIDEHGMFRIRLMAGSYRLQLAPTRAGVAPIELPILDLP